VEQQCRVAEVSRAGFYRYLQQTAPEQADMLLRARLQELAVEHHTIRLKAPACCRVPRSMIVA
jgi:hypothetical protein